MVINSIKLKAAIYYNNYFTVPKMVRATEHTILKIGNKVRYWL